jgi:hypothetical protein
VEYHAFSLGKAHRGEKAIARWSVIMADGHEDGKVDSRQERIDIPIPPKYRIRTFLRAQFATALQVSLRTASRYTTPDYTPESLERLEPYLGQSPEDYRKILIWSNNHGFSNSPDQLWLMWMTLGCYFGEVLVRNLGGKWKYPSRLYGYLAVAFNWPGLAYRHWYVIVGKQKVPVFELSRRRCVMGPDESIYRACQLIAKGQFKNYPMGPRYPSKEA